MRRWCEAGIRLSTFSAHAGFIRDLSRVDKLGYICASLAPIAQSVERLHGKEKVCGSIPHGGSDEPRVKNPGSTHGRETNRVLFHGGIAQAVEQTAHNRCVTGSSPVPATETNRRRE